MTRTAIEARGITKAFGEGETRTLALRGVDLTATFGEMIYIVGPSGSGKTTLLSVLSGILRPDAGTVSVDGVEIWKLGTDALAEFRRNRIGFVFQDYHLFPRLTTAENVAIPLILRREDWDQAVAKAVQVLDVVGLRGRANLPPVKLSGGEQQRVAIARAIVGDAAVILADEPTASLDSENGHSIMTFLAEIAKSSERGVLVVTHDPRILPFANRVVRIEDGKIIGEERLARETKTKRMASVGL